MTDCKLAPRSIVDDLAQFIRKVDGNNRMGAGALAEKICERFRVDAPVVQGEPVSAQVRYRRPEKGLPSWSAWQPAEVDETKPTYHFDAQGWEVEYRLLYTAPQPTNAYACTVPDDCETLHWRGQILSMNELVSMQPAPDVSALVEALEPLMKGYASLLEGGIDRITHLDGDCDLILDMLQDAQTALAAYRKQGVKS